LFAQAHGDVLVIVVIVNRHHSLSRSLDHNGARHAASFHLWRYVCVLTSCLGSEMVDLLIGADWQRRNGGISSLSVRFDLIKAKPFNLLARCCSANLTCRGFSSFFGGGFGDLGSGVVEMVRD
jgi:hypothetical protein